MAWFAELAGKAESLLNNIDEQTGAALRNHNVIKQKKHDCFEYSSSPAVGHRRRPIPRNLKKNHADLMPSDARKLSPTAPHSTVKDWKDGTRSPRGRSPSRMSYNLHNAPKTLVGDVPNEIFVDQFDYRERRYSLPTDLKGITKEKLLYGLENLEIENTMLKNELNVMNREVSELLLRLRKAEDGEDVVSSIKEFKTTGTILEDTERNNQKLNISNKLMLSQLDQLKDEIDNLNSVEIKKYKNKIKELDTEFSDLKDINKGLEEEVNKLKEQTSDKENARLKLETDLRHAQSTIHTLQSDLEKSNTECKRLEKDWETYKLRVKSMLTVKDNEIKALKDGISLSEDTKMLIGQIDNLKEERELLDTAITRVRGECEDMKNYMSTLESRHNAAERVVVALREALRDERAARNRVEAQCTTITKELKNIQIETGQTIASLRTALRDKESELHRLNESVSSVRSPDTSALNVADYGVSDVSVDNEKVYHLTQKLVHRQGKIDSLLADNNMMRIQLEKLESKYKTELQARLNSHSVVQLQDGDRSRSRWNQQDSSLARLSRRMGVWIQRNPLFRIFIIIYMIGLHLWVLAVLLTSTPENYATRPSKS